MLGFNIDPNNITFIIIILIIIDIIYLIKMYLHCILKKDRLIKEGLIFPSRRNEK